MAKVSTNISLDADLKKNSQLLFQDLGIDKLQECAEVFKGTHNYTNFTKRFQKTTTILPSSLH